MHAGAARAGVHCGRAAAARGAGCPAHRSNHGRRVLGRCGARVRQLVRRALPCSHVITHHHHTSSHIIIMSVLGAATPWRPSPCERLSHEHSLKHKLSCRCTWLKCARGCIYPNQALAQARARAQASLRRQFIALAFHLAASFESGVIGVSRSICKDSVTSLHICSK